MSLWPILVTIYLPFSDSIDALHLRLSVNLLSLSDIDDGMNEGVLVDIDSVGSYIA